MTVETDPLDSFEHVVVLMLENRSFDNLLGYLYPSELPNGGTYEGLQGKRITNPIPRDLPPPEHPVGGDTATEIVAKQGTNYHAPFPDPGETYPHVNTQLFNKINGCYNLPSKRPLPKPSMQGFVHDYVRKLIHDADGAWPSYEQYRQIMDNFPPESVSVLSDLAECFAVFDHWHCDVPSQTWCNRAFWHAATSYGQVINGPSLKWFCGSKAPNLFTRLSRRFGDPTDGTAEKTAWRIYSPAFNFISLTFFLHLRALFRYDDDEHFRHLEHFFDDCANGGLPRYTFLEPLFLFQHNDQHPSSLKGLADGPDRVGSVLLGEHLIWRIYEAVRQSASTTGNNAENTLLVITHDEHGGCFDHVPPRAGAKPPSCKAVAGQDGFTFDRFGVRVPMVMVSAHIRPGTIVSDPHSHTSFLKTMEQKWGLEHLTCRDQAATPFTSVFNSAEARPSSEWPKPAEPYLPLSHCDQDESLHSEELYDFQLSLVRAAGVTYGVPVRDLEGLETTFQAHELFTRRVAASRGRKRSLWRILASLLRAKHS